MKISLFKNSIEPACQYCEIGRLTKDRQLVLCPKKGSMQPYDNCKNFVYAPLKRIPTKTVKLASYNKEDFKI